MRNFFVLLIACLSSVMALAQQVNAAEGASPSKPVVKKVRYVAPSAKKAVPVVAEPTAAAPMIKPFAGVFTGRMTCELGQVIHVSEDEKEPGTFFVQTPKTVFRMSQVSTSTGAVRLEDAKQGALWLQLPAKSMLMDTRRGQRLADECQSPEQVAASEQMKQSPQQNLLEGQAELAKK